jgi:hypothetical protein
LYNADFGIELEGKEENPVLILWKLIIVDHMKFSSFFFGQNRPTFANWEWISGK